MITPLIGVSKNIQRIKELIEHVADTGLNIVICGESGVGKEVVAQNLYQKSPRVGKPFLKINCAALPEGLLESELFGYESGAFTGADRKKRGKFELAHKGVLMLDEIGDMSLPLQSKMLHVLQSGEYSPLGSEKDVKTDAWIIAATNHALEEDIQKGTFREDLYYRLNIIRINISPLRERPEDIPLLVDHFIKSYSGNYAGRTFTAPPAHIMDLLCHYPWPGNVRELQNILKRFAVMEDWDEVVKDLAPGPFHQAAAKNNPVTEETGISRLILELFDLDRDRPPDLAQLSLKAIRQKAVDRIEKETIAYVLGKTGWNRSQASRILGVSYKTLLYKIGIFNLNPPQRHQS